MQSKLISCLILTMFGVTLYSQGSKSPKNLDDCFVILENEMKQESIDQFKSFHSDSIVRYHHTLGKSIRNNFKLWNSKSHMAVYFSKMNIYSADDMSAIIITSWHRKLNDREINFDQQISVIKQYWKSQNCGSKGCQKEMPSLWDCKAINGSLN